MPVPEPEPRDRSPRVTVVIPSWNGRELLARCLAALDRQALPDLAVTVVDNGSADDTVGWLRAERPAVRVLALPGNRGFAAAVDAGIVECRTEYVALLNNDTEPAPQWLAELVSALDRRRDCGFAASLIVRMDAPEIVDTAGDRYTLYGQAWKRGEGLSAAAFRGEEIVPAACAGAALYRRELFEDVGLFEPRFFAYFEDVDWSLRARLLGHRCLFVPAAVVRHAVGATSGRISRTAVRLRGRNMVYLLLRTMPAPLLVAGLPGVVLTRLVGVFLLALRGELSATLGGYLDALRDLGWILRSRSEIQRRRRVPILEFAASLDFRLVRKEQLLRLRKLFPGA